MPNVELIDPTHCQDCNASLERGYSYVYQGDQIVSARCFSCADIVSLKQYQETKVLRSSFTTTNMLHVNKMGLPAWSNLRVTAEEVAAELTAALSNPKYSSDDISRIEALISVQNIYTKIKEFEQKVWFGGLQAMASKSRVKGFSAHTKLPDEFRVMTYTMAGRVMFTIENNKTSITTICSDNESESTMGLQGIACTEEQATYLLDKAIGLFEAKQLDFQDDVNVSVI